MATDSYVWPGERLNDNDQESRDRLRNDALLAFAGDVKPKADEKATVPAPPVLDEQKGATKPAPPADQKPAEAKPASTTDASPGESKPAKDTKDAGSAKPELRVCKSVFECEGFTSKIRFGRVQLKEGRSRQDLADGASLEYDSNDKLSKVRYSDGTTREFKWSGDTLTGVKTRTGEWFDRLLAQGKYWDRWVKKDNNYWDGTIKVDEESGDYTLVENGKTDKQINKANGSTDVLRTDKSRDVQFISKATSKYDSTGNITELKAADGRSATLKWEAKPKEKDEKEGKEAPKILTGATITSEGKTSAWQLKDGKWLRDGKETDSRLVADNESGKLTIIEASGKDEIWHQAGMLERKNKDGSTTITQKNADGSSVDLAFKQIAGKTEIVSISTTRNGTTEVWERKQTADDKELSSTWTNKGTAATEVRENVALSPLGVLSFKRADGATYLNTADGKESVVHRSPDWAIYYENGRVARADFRDGVTRVFTWDGDAVASVSVQRPESTTVWNKIGKDKYKAGNDEYAARITVNRNGDYSFLELNNEKVETIRRPNGLEIIKNEATKTETERDAGRLTRLVIDKNERIYQRDEKGKLNAIADPSRNTVWKRDKDDLWTAEAQNKDKPFTAPEQLKRKGTGEPTDEGTSVFVGDDNILVQDNLDGTTKKFDTAKDMVKRVLDSTDINADERYEFLNNIAALEGRTLDAKERTAVYKEVNRMLDDTSTTPFTAKDRTKLASQSVWMMANPHRNEQGAHNTCNVTAIRNCIVREEPSQFARLIADVATTGKFDTFDKTEIKPHDFSLKAGSEEQQKPLPAGARTWAGQIWDVTAANVYWQRATVDPKGFVVPKGSMYYDQVVPQSRGDSVERLYRYDPSGTVYEVANPEGNVTRHPYLTPSAMNDIYEQITGSQHKEKIIINSSLGSGRGLAPVKTADELHDLLKKGPLPKIIQIHTSRQPFYADSGHGSAGGAGGKGGGWHVVAITGYDEKNKTVQFDNSWSPNADHLTKAREVPLQQMYDATIGQYPVTQSQQKQQQSTRLIEIHKPKESDDAEMVSNRSRRGKLTDRFSISTNETREVDIVRGLEILNQGKIDSMVLPDGWLPKKRAKESFVQQKSDQFQLPGTDGTLNFFYRGTPLSEESGEAFMDVLGAKPHKLSQSELTKLSQTLGTLGDKNAFELQSAKTIDVNGKRVLEIGGTWKSGGKKFHGLLLNAGGEGTIVQEVFYEASSKIFDDNVQKVKNAMGTIRWK